MFVLITIGQYYLTKNVNHLTKPDFIWLPVPNVINTVPTSFILVTPRCIDYRNCSFLAALLQLNLQLNFVETHFLLAWLLLWCQI